MNLTTIEWCDYTTNPEYGCDNKCFYCYARSLHNMRHNAFIEGKKMPEQYAKPFHELQFFENRLKEFKNVKLPIKRNRIAQIISPNKPIVFVVSMGDLMGKNVPMEWIEKTMNAISKNPNTEFMILTKNPWRFHQLKSIPNNAWLGCTVTCNKDDYDLSAINSLPETCKRFISVEPILGKCDDLTLDKANFVVVGAMTGRNPVIPQMKWIESLNEGNIHYKDNILKYLPKKQTA